MPLKVGHVLPPASISYLLLAGVCRHGPPFYYKLGVLIDACKYIWIFVNVVAVGNTAFEVV